MLVPLDQLCHEINVRFEKAAKADDHRLAAGKLLAEARARLPDEQPGVSWTTWCSEKIKRSYRDVQRCLRLAGADDPAEARELEKKQARHGMAEHRSRATNVSRPTANPKMGEDADLRSAVLALPDARLAGFRDWLVDYCMEKGV